MGNDSTDVTILRFLAWGRALGEEDDAILAFDLGADVGGIFPWWKGLVQSSTRVQGRALAVVCLPIAFSTMESDRKRVVFLVDIGSMEGSSTGSLKCLIGHFLIKVLMSLAVPKVLWGWSFFNSLSTIQCKERRAADFVDFSLSTFQDFVSDLDSFEADREADTQEVSPELSSPAEHIKKALRDVIIRYSWEMPDISSPSRRKRSSNRTDRTSHQHKPAKFAGKHCVFVLTPCPLSCARWKSFVKFPSKETLLPNSLLQQFKHKDIKLFFVDISLSEVSVSNSYGCFTHVDNVNFYFTILSCTPKLGWLSGDLWSAQIQSRDLWSSKLWNKTMTSSSCVTSITCPTSIEHCFGGETRIRKLFAWYVLDATHTIYGTPTINTVDTTSEIHSCAARHEMQCCCKRCNFLPLCGHMQSTATGTPHGGTDWHVLELMLCREDMLRWCEV